MDKVHRSYLPLCNQRMAREKERGEKNTLPKCLLIGWFRIMFIFRQSIFLYQLHFWCRYQNSIICLDFIFGKDVFVCFFSLFYFILLCLYFYVSERRERESRECQINRDQQFFLLCFFLPAICNFTIFNLDIRQSFCWHT